MEHPRDPVEDVPLIDSELERHVEEIGPAIGMRLLPERVATVTQVINSGGEAYVNTVPLFAHDGADIFNSEKFLVARLSHECVITTNPYYEQYKAWVANLHGLGYRDYRDRPPWAHPELRSLKNAVSCKLATPGSHGVRIDPVDPVITAVLPLFDQPEVRYNKDFLLSEPKVDEAILFIPYDWLDASTIQPLFIYVKSRRGVGRLSATVQPDTLKLGTYNISYCLCDKCEGNPDARRDFGCCHTLHWKDYTRHPAWTASHRTYVCAEVFPFDMLPADVVRFMHTEDLMPEQYHSVMHKKWKKAGTPLIGRQRSIWSRFSTPALLHYAKQIYILYYAVLPTTDIINMVYSMFGGDFDDFDFDTIPHRDMGFESAVHLLALLLRLYDHRYYDEVDPYELVTDVVGTLEEYETEDF